MNEMFGISIPCLLLLSFLSGVAGIYIIVLRDTFHESPRRFLVIGTMSFFEQLADLLGKSIKNFLVIAVVLFIVGWACAIISLFPYPLLKAMRR